MWSLSRSKWLELSSIIIWTSWHWRTASHSGGAKLEDDDAMAKIAKILRSRRCFFFQFRFSKTSLRRRLKFIPVQSLQQSLSQVKSIKTGEKGRKEASKEKAAIQREGLDWRKAGRAAALAKEKRRARPKKRERKAARGPDCERESERRRGGEQFLLHEPGCDLFFREIGRSRKKINAHGSRGRLDRWLRGRWSSLDIGLPPICFTKLKFKTSTSRGWERDKQTDRQQDYKGARS